MFFAESIVIDVIVANSSFSFGVVFVMSPFSPTVIVAVVPRER